MSRDETWKRSHGIQVSPFFDLFFFLLRLVDTSAFIVFSCFCFSEVAHTSATGRKQNSHNLIKRLHCIRQTYKRHCSIELNFRGLKRHRLLATFLAKLLIRLVASWKRCCWHARLSWVIAENPVKKAPAMLLLLCRRHCNDTTYTQPVVIFN